LVICGKFSRQERKRGKKEDFRRVIFFEMAGTVGLGLLYKAMEQRC
jgi:hypothetical protein